MNYVEFPEIGVRFQIDPVAFKIFGNEIYFYGIIIAFAFLLSLLLAYKDCDRYGISQDDFTNMVLIATPSAIVLARFFYVIFELDNYKDDLWQVFNFRNGGLAIYGAIIGVGISLIIYTKKKKLNLLNILDFAAPYFPIAQAIGRFGNFFNQEAFGSNTKLPWGMTGNRIVAELERLQSIGVNVNPQANVHPTFLYESLWNIAVFLIVLYVRKNKRSLGESVFSYMALYGLGRFFIEGLRMDSLMLWGMRINQILALVFFIVFGTLFIYRRYINKDHNKKNKEINSPFSKLKEETIKNELNNKEDIDNNNEEQIEKND